MKLSNYWPLISEVDACIKNEAETAAESVLLAVHRKVEFLVELSGQESQKNEDQLLKEFLTPNVPSGALIMPILGASGIGKSHVVRWLQAMIQRQRDSSKYHIIRIPKTANLRKVVELILGPLKKNKNYEKIRRDLDEAVQNVTEQELITRFVAELTNQIRAYGEQARTQMGTAEREVKQKLRKEIGFSQNLPLLFTDAALQDYFNSHVFNRLTKRSFSGSKSDEDFDELPQFKTSDFDFPDTVNISMCARAVNTYISQNIVITDSTVKNSIIEFLNGHQLIDRALKRAYNINGDFGGKTLEELILDIRDELFKEGKELVLLIEDFAALTGFQDTLLNVAIQEGQVDGKQVRATMRTAVAVTDGYQLTDTISTRAKSRWRIRSRSFENNESIVVEIEDMVGAYLNAARWGKDNLDEKYRSNRNNSDWVGIYKDEGINDDEDRVLDTFGKSLSGFPLFPFNRNAITVLANSYLRDRTGALVFTPRELINQIIRPTLLERDLYQRGHFPTNYENVRPKTSVSLVGSNVPGDETLKNRVKTILAVWGGNPERLEDITGMGEAVFEVFSISVPNILDLSANVNAQRSNTITIRQDTTNDQAASALTTTPIVQTDAHLVRWKETIEDWSSGERLPQQVANRLRNWIAESVVRHIQWDTTGIPKPPNRPMFSIANADGEGTAGEKIIICDSHTDQDGKLRAAFVALYRFNNNSFSWDYEGSDTDYEYVIELIERVSAEWLKLLEIKQQKTIAVLARHLRLQARILGFAPPQSTKPYDKLIETIFSEATIDTLFQDYDSEWRDLCLSVANERDTNPSWRAQIKSELLKNIASYQGQTGTTPQSIDASKLIAALSIEVDGQDAAMVSANLREYFTIFNERKVLRTARVVKQKLENDYNIISEKIGDTESFDKSYFITSMTTLKDSLVAIGCFPTINEGFDSSLPTFTQTLADLRNFSISSTIQALKKINDVQLTPEKNAGILNELGTLDFSRTGYVIDVFKQAELLCTIGQAKIKAKKQLTDGQDLGAMRAQIASMLTSLRDL
jgi:hypothetical protein